MSLHRAVRLIDVIQHIIDKEDNEFVTLVLYGDESGHYDYDGNEVFSFENLDDIPLRFADWIAKRVGKEVDDV